MTKYVAALLLAFLPFVSAYPHDDSDGAEDLLKAVKRARLIDLSHAWTNSSPIASVNPPYHFSLAATHANTRGTFGDGGQLSFTSEVQNFSGQHGAPSIDALGHIGRDGKLFGGVDAAASTSNPNGIGQSGVGAHLAIDQFPKDLLVNRGVLLDVASMVNGDLTPLPARFEITAKHLQDAARRQKVQVRRGDTVFIRTGWGQYFASASALYAGADSPGPGVDGANWLIKQGARIVGDDTLTFEQRPPLSFDAAGNVTAVFPVHMRLIADSGIFIIENLDLEGLAKAKAYEFVAVVPPLKVLGGTGSAVRVFALVARDD
jgi:kynurenine formamidase